MKILAIRRKDISLGHYMLVLFMISILNTSHVFSQTIFNVNTGTTLPLNFDAPSRGVIFRSHAYNNTDPVNDFNGDLGVQYDLNNPFTIPGEIGIREVNIVVTNQSLDIRPASYDPTVSPFSANGWVGSLITGNPVSCNGNTGGNSAPNAEIVATFTPPLSTSFGVASAIPPSIVSNLCIPSNSFVYIIETIEINSCIPDGTGFTTRLLLDFYKILGNHTTVDFPFQPGGILNVANEIPVFTLTETAIPGNTLRARTFFDNSCSPETYARKLVYTLENGSMRDPSFVFGLNNNTDDQITLSETELDQIKIRFELDLVDDGVFNADVSTQFVTFDILRNALVNSGLNQQNAPVDQDGNNTYASPPFVSTSPTVTDEYWDIANAPNATGVRTASMITTSPSMRGTAIPEVFTSLLLRMSNMVVPSVTPGGPPQLDTHTPFSLYNPATGNQNDRDAVYLKIFEGSKIIIEYEAEVVAQEMIHTDYSRFRNRRVEMSRQIFSANGYTECGDGEGFYRNLYPIGGVESFEQINVLGISNTMSGNPDHNLTTWDGDLQEFTANLGKLNYRSNKTKAFDFDASCSEVEFQVDFGQGLSVPCPCDLNPTIAFLPPSSPFCSSSASGGITHYIAGAQNTFLGIPSSSYLGNCGTSSTGSPALPALIDASDLFWIELNDGTILTPVSAGMEIIPEYGPSGAMVSQRWKVRFPAASFISYTSSGSSNISQDLMENATLHFIAKAICPASEPKTDYSLSTYYVMGKCAGPTNVSYTNGSGNGVLSCSSICNTLCPNSRLFLGRIDKTVTITCPGCKTPGGLVPTNVVHERHPDYLGYADTDNDGFPDSLSTPNIANPLTDTEVNTQLIRHGDVVTAEVLTGFYDGGSLNLTTGESYNVFDLANAGNISISGNSSFPGCSGLSDLSLTAWVYELAGVDLNKYFVPLIKGPTSSVSSLINEFDTTDQLNYQNLANDYPSQIRIQIDNIVSTWIDIDPSHVVWKDGNTMRFVYDLPQILSLYTANPDLSAAPQPSYLDNVINSRIKIRFRFNLLTDVDISPNTWTNQEKSFGRELTLTHLMFGSDGTSASWLTPDGQTGNYRISTGDGNTTLLCDIAPGIEWYCEKGEGKLLLAPYIENRYMNNYIVPTNGANKYFEAFIDNLDNISPGAEMSHQLVLQTGNAESGVNFFKNEVRYPATPEFVELFLPEPYVPEAVFLTNGYSVNSLFYSANDAKGINYILHLQDQNGILHPTMDASGNTTGVSYPYGITIQEGVVMPANLFPHYSATYNGLTPINGTGVLGDYQGEPIFDNSAVNQVPHWRIRIPIEVFNDPTVLNAAISHESVANNPNVAKSNMYIAPGNSIPSWFPGNTSALGGALPCVVADESFVLTTGIIYSQPTCQAPSWVSNGAAIHADAGYTEDCGFYHEKNDFWYYHGNDESVLSIFNQYQSVQVVEKDASGSYNLSPSDFSGSNGYLHPKFETPLMMPSRIKTGDLIASTFQTSHLKSDVKGVDNHPLLNPNFRTAFSGAVPAFYSSTIQSNITHYSPYNRAPNFLSDQRSNLSILPGATTDIQVDVATGVFTLSFKLKDSVLREMMPYAAPCDVDLLQGNTVSNWMTANGLTTHYTLGGNLSSRFESLKGVPTIRSIDGKPNIDLSNFYFFFRPKATGPSIDLKTIRIKKVELGQSPAQAHHYTLPSHPDGILSCDITANDNPRLFYIGDINAAGQQFNGATKTVTVTGYFDCSDSLIQSQLLNTSSNIQLPFDVVVNYNCERDSEPWRAQNKTQFVTGQNSANGRAELTYETAQRTRCSNDLILEEYTLEPPQLDFVVQMDETTSMSTLNCDRTFNLSFTNSANGEVSPKRIVLKSPLIAPVGWTLIPGTTNEYEYLFTTTTALSANQSTSINVTFSAVGCNDLNLSNLIGFADSYCSNCSTCELDKSGMINQSVGSSPITLSGLIVTNESCVNSCDGGINILVNSNSSNLSYQLNGGVISPLAQSSLAISSLCAGTYTLTVFSGNCCQTSQQFTILPGMEITPSFDPIGPICQGSLFTLPTTSTNQIAGTWSPAINTQQTTTYTFTPNQNQCAGSTTLTVIVNTATPVATLPSLTLCSPYVLPTLPAGNVYYDAPSGPSGIGNVLPVGTVVSSTQTIYIFADALPPCIPHQSSFVITINPLPTIPVTLVHPDCSCDGEINWPLPLPGNIQSSLAMLTSPGTYTPVANNINLCSGEYELTFTDSGSGCTSTQTIFLGNTSASMIPQHLTTLNSSTVLPSQSSAVNPIVVTGSVNIAQGTSLTLSDQFLIIDPNATFVVNGQLDVNGTTILFRKETHEINIGSTGVMIVNELNGAPSLLTSGDCGKVWTGVSNEGYFEINQSIIEQALVGIRSYGSGPQTLASESVFRDNYIGVYVSNDSVMHLSLTENKFSVNQNTGLLPFFATPPGAPIQFRANQHVYVQLCALNSIPSTITGFCTIQENRFRYAETGVILDNSKGITIDKNNRFRATNTGISVGFQSNQITIDGNHFRTDHVNETGINFNSNSNGSISNNKFSSLTPSLISNYIGINVEDGCIISNAFFNRFRSISGKNDKGIFVSNNSIFNAENNRFTSFDHGIIGQSGSEMTLINNRINNSFLAIELDDVKLAVVEENTIANPSNQNQPNLSTVGIRIIEDVLNGQAQIVENTLQGVDRGILVSDNGDAHIKNNRIKIANQAIILDASGNCQVVSNEIETANDIGVLIKDIPSSNPVQVYENMLTEVQNGIRLEDSWFSTVSANVISTNGLPLNSNGSNNGIALIRTGYLAVVSSSNFAIERNKISGFRNGIFTRRSEFNHMMGNEIENCRTGVRLNQVSYFTPPLLQENIFRSNFVGLRCNRLVSNGPITPFAELKLECNIFEATQSRAISIQIGQWSFKNANSNPLVTNLYVQSGAAPNAFRRIHVDAGAGLMHQYPNMTSLPPFGTPFYSPTVTGTGSPLPIGSSVIHGNPCITPSFSIKSSMDVPETIASELDVYPNPTNGQFELVSNGAMMRYIKITNSFGVSILEKEIDTEVWRFDLSGFECGVYNVSITISDGHVVTKRIVLVK